MSDDRQLDLCAPYLADHADYRVLVVPAGEGWPLKPARISPLDCAHWEQVVISPDYEHAVRIAREHCLVENCEVWVVDRNAEGDVAFRVRPQEYTARGISLL